MKGAPAAVLILAACSAPLATDAQPREAEPDAPTMAPAPAAPPAPLDEPVEPLENQDRIVELTGALVQGGFARGQAVNGRADAVLLNGRTVPMLDDGRFFIAFGRDEPAQVTLDIRYADGLTVSRTLEIADTEFPESRLPPITQQIEASEDFRERRAEQLARITAARERRSALTGWAETFIRPAEGRTSGVFGSQRFYGDEARSPHSGMDIAAPPGAPVIAPAAGEVVLAGGGYSFEGNLVIVDHGLGLYSAFLHLSAIEVEVGDMLAKGDPVGKVGASGRATGPHLHWGVWWDGVRFDPETLLSVPG